MTELEKKAIDVIRNHSHKLIDKFTQEDLENREISIFMAGYHEGNKANEWHFVKDELPEKEKYVLVYTKLENVYMARLVKNNYFINKNGGFVQTSSVIAWKEIVLPKLPKEN